MAYGRLDLIEKEETPHNNFFFFKKKKRVSPALTRAVLVRPWY
jgi:hypothetical protein